ncbi:MAG: hypothetical protein ABW169_00530 [Sphingobium sp.]
MPMGRISASIAARSVAFAQMPAIRAARTKGVAIVQSTRARSGSSRALGIIPADNLNPQKARILRALALTATDDPGETCRIFADYQKVASRRAQPRRFINGTTRSMNVRIPSIIG